MDGVDADVSSSMGGRAGHILGKYYVKVRFGAVPGPGVQSGRTAGISG